MGRGYKKTKKITNTKTTKLKTVGDKAKVAVSVKQLTPECIRTNIQYAMLLHGICRMFAATTHLPSVTQ